MTAVAAPAAADPVASPPAPVEPAAARAPPAPEAPAVESVPTSDTKGPIPFDRHESILKNARAKTEADVTQKWQQQYAPHVELGTRIQQDAIGTVVGLVEGLANHPDYGPQMISALARTLGARRGQALPQTDQEPQADLQAADGTLVFSAEQLAKREAYQRTKLLAEVDQRLQPLQTREQQYQAQEQARVAQQQAHESMSKVFAPYQAQPEFEQHRPAIAAKWTDLVREGHDAVSALGLAYAAVLRETVMPSRTAQSQQSLMAEAVKKSTGSTTAPGASPAGPAKRPASMAEGFSAIQL